MSGEKGSSAETPKPHQLLSTKDLSINFGLKSRIVCGWRDEDVKLKVDWTECKPALKSVLELITCNQRRYSYVENCLQSLQVC